MPTKPAPWPDACAAQPPATRPLKIAVDCGNGVAGAFAPTLYSRLGCDVVPLYCDVDGRFPNHHPDPSQPDNLRDMIKRLEVGDCDLGLAFDGDGDRLGVVTKDGNNIFPDRQIMLFAKDVLSRVPGAPIIFDVKCSQRLAIAIKEAGGVPLMYKTGHSLVKAKLKEMKSPFAGVAQSLTETVVLLVTITVAVNALGADLSFITSNLVLIFAVVQALLTPLITKTTDRKAPVLTAVAGLLSTFAALIITAIVSDGLNVDGLSTWFIAALIIWLVTLIATFLLPFLLVKMGLESARERRS